MGETDYKSLIENSHTQTEFAKNVGLWRLWYSRAYGCYPYLWQVRELAHLNPEQNTWLADCIKETHGAKNAEHYTECISVVYDITEHCPDFISVFDALLQMGATAETVADMQSVCGEYCVTFGRCSKTMTHIAKYGALADIAETDTGNFFMAARELRQRFTKRDFTKVLDYMWSFENYFAFCKFVSLLTEELGYSPYQIQWLQEHEKQATEEIERFDYDWAMAEREMETETGATIQPKPLYQKFLNVLTPTQRERVNKYFPRAIKAKFMTETEQGFRWREGRGARAQLAWFIVRVLDWQERQNTYAAMIEKLFGVTSMRVAMRATLLLKKTQPYETELQEKVFSDNANQTETATGENLPIVEFLD